MGKYLKLFETDSERVGYEDGENYIEPYVSYVEVDNSVHYNKPKFFCKLTLNNGSTVELEGSGELTQAMVSQYKGTLVSAEIGEFCTSIGDSAFDNCNGLSSVTISNSVTSIGYGVFNGCSSLTSVIIGCGVTSIGIAAFSGCRGLTSVTIPDSVTSIGISAFASCIGLTSITIGSGVTSIGSDAFFNCSSLTNVLADCNAAVDGVFRGFNSVENVIIGNNVTSIGRRAFDDCKNLRSITIGDNVTSIGDEAFYSCTNLTNITSLATTAPTIQSSTFQNIKTNGTLTVPSGSSGYDVWMGTGNYYLGKYGWTKVE